MAQERGFQARPDAPQCGGLCAKPVMIGDFSGLNPAEKVGRKRIGGGRGTGIQRSLAEFR